MREAGPSLLPDHPWQLKQVPLLSYSRFPFRSISAEASFEYPSKGEVNFLAVPHRCAGTRGSKGAFSPLTSYEWREVTSVDSVVWSNEHAVRIPASTKKSCKRADGDLGKVMSKVEAKTFLSWTRSLAWLAP
jgi:hypothetical protein